MEFCITCAHIGLSNAFSSSIQKGGFVRTFHHCLFIMLGEIAALCAFSESRYLAVISERIQFDLSAQVKVDFSPNGDRVLLWDQREDGKMAKVINAYVATGSTHLETLAFSRLLIKSDLKLGSKKYLTDRQTFCTLVPA
jgi:hypothetical protein